MSLSASVRARVSGTTATALAAMLLLGASGTHAADQPIRGKKLLIKSPLSGAAQNKVVHLSKDVSITVGAAGGSGDPQCTGVGGGGGSLRIAASGGAGDVIIPLPCANWTTNGSNTLYGYRDTSGATCTLVLVKSGVLAKAICRGAQVGIDVNGSMSPTAVVTTLNANRYCTEYGGDVVKDGSDDKTFLRKDAPPPPTCPSTTSSTSTTSTSSSTTSTSPSDPVCCDANSNPPCLGTTNGVCVSGLGGTPTYNAVCDATESGCVAPPGTPGDCCENVLPGSCMMLDAVGCADFGGTLHANSVCQPGGSCTP